MGLDGKQTSRLDGLSGRTEPDHPRLSPTGRVILGMIASGTRTGYDIKQLVDKSTRHFWAASYGQIYPELKRLQQQGLIQGVAEPSGGRARVVYELTPRGEAALQSWLSSRGQLLDEARDEGMLKLFFSDLATPEQRLENIRQMRAVQEGRLAALQAVRAHKGEAMRSGPRLTLELGVGVTEWLIGWCETTEKRLAAETD